MIATLIPTRMKTDFNYPKVRSGGRGLSCNSCRAWKLSIGRDAKYSNCASAWDFLPQEMGVASIIVGAFRVAKLAFYSTS